MKLSHRIVQVGSILAIGAGGMLWATNLSEPPKSPFAATQQSNAHDLRAVAAINTFNGQGDLGRNPRWGDGSTRAQSAWLRKQCQMAYDAGYRRIVFILPAGTSGYPMSSNQYHALSDGARKAIASCVSTLRGIDSEVEFGIYAGFDLHDVDGKGHDGERRTPDFGLHTDRAAMGRQFGAWAELGITEIWWDFASTAPRRQSALLFGAWLEREYGLTCHGEAIPRNWPSDSGEIDNELARGLGGWMALPNFYSEHDPGRFWMAPEGAALFVGLRSGDNPSDEEMKSWRGRGFAPWVYSRVLDQRVKLVWGF